MAHRFDEEWRLYVDESGAFEDPEDDVCVAGLLVQLGRDRGLEELRPALRRAFGGVWPFKASHINQPAFLAVLALAARNAPAGRRSLLGAVDDALAKRVARAEPPLRRICAKPLDRAVVAVLGGELPDFDDLLHLDHGLREHAPKERRWLDERAREQRALVPEILRSFKATGADAPRAAPTLLAVAAGEAERSDAASREPAEDDGSSRYLTLLAILVERAARLLGRSEGRRALELCVLSREVRDPSLGVPARLHLPLLDRLARSVEPSLSERVTLRPLPPRDYAREPLVGCVLSDVIANRARWWLRLGRRSLPVVEGRLEDALGAPFSSGDAPRSHLAASGMPRDYLERIRAGERPAADVRSRHELRRWAREQAAEWAGAKVRE